MATIPPKPPTVKPLIAQSQFTSQGCTFTLKTDKVAYEPGESPAIEVTATNTTDKPVTASVWVMVTSMRPMAHMSRMMPRPTTLWSEQYAFTLEPGQKKSQSLTCSAKLPDGQEVRIFLGDKKNAVLTNNYVPGGANANVPAGGPNANPTK